MVEHLAQPASGDVLVDKGQAGQGNALPAEGGVDSQRGLVEAQIPGAGLTVLGEQFGQEPGPEIVGVVQHDERLQLREASGRVGTLEQGRAGYSDNTLLHQPFTVQPRADVRVAIAHGNIHAVSAEVRQPIGRQHPQIDVWVALGKRAEPGYQPFRGKGRGHADRQVGSLWPEQARGLIDHGQGVADAGAVAQARIGQRQAAGQALEQAQAKARFQPAYLLRNSGLGHAQLLGRQPKVQVAGDHFKNT